MFTLFGKPYRHCDGITRRHFLTAGALGLGGLTLADVLRAEAAAGKGTSNKAIINIHLDGGPPHLDTIDLKPDAPSEVRGEFKPIATKIPGLQISELMPKVAGIADKFALIRSLVGSAGAHDAFQCQSGFRASDLRSLGGRPALGSVVAKLRGSADDPAPPFVDLMQGRPHVRNSARPGFLGPTYTPFRPDISKMFARELEPGMKKELAARGEDHAIQLTLVDGLTPERLSDRTLLRSAFDDARRDLDTAGSMEAMDRFTQQAASILTSGRFAAAMDLSKEPAKVLERYTPPVAAAADRFYTSEDGMAARKLLLARRLVEAGVRCVSVSFSDFDTHANNFGRMRQLLPIVDHALHALVTDLDERGLLGDVAIVVWGEFGRTPKINKKAGRDHWPEASPALLTGGGLKGGQVIGATDRQGGRVVSRPVQFQDVFATLYSILGIDPSATTLTDPNGRPQHLLERGEPLRELV
ncbi:MAG TPA: DUF1501 domain-containing protein [Gemmataceae bacterium]|jgi:hypothetical protein